MRKRPVFSDVLAWLLVALMGLLGAFSFLMMRYGWKIYLELFSHFQVQYLIIDVALCAVVILLRCRWQTYIGLFLVVLFALPVLGWYSASAFDVFPTFEQPAHLRILSANVNTKNDQYEKVLSYVRSHQPDMVAFIEVDDVWQQQLDDLRDLLPYAYGKTSPDNFGLLLYSKQPLENVRTDYFGTEDYVSVVAQTTFQGAPITLVATHPPPPIRADIFHTRNRQLDVIQQFLSTVNTEKIVVGDLNITMWSPYYRRFVNKAKLANTRKGVGIMPTWPARHHKIPTILTPLFQIPIDHCLTSDGLSTQRISVEGDLGSDHKPLLVDVVLNGAS
ncbi:MAG: endonuclease/exonuclease/phosphatase family protein [Cyanobacteria bacterium J06573_11]